MSRTREPLPDVDGAAGMAAALKDNITRLSERRKRELVDAPLSEKLAVRVTAAAGSMPFVALHLLVFGGWILDNAGLLPGLKAFDPQFSTLSMIASVEAIFLSTFVLISQNRMAAVADKRADLDLHISLLAEHELTKLAQLVERIAGRVGVAVADPDFEEIKKPVQPETVLDAIEATGDVRELP